MGPEEVLLFIAGILEPAEHVGNGDAIPARKLRQLDAR
jgi:hypothetical protein